MSLMYADDLAQCSDTCGALQCLLNTLEQFYNQWGLVVNMAKTKKIVFFRNGGPLKDFEKCYFKGSEIEIVSHYKYLEIFFRLSWNGSTLYKLWILKLKKRYTRCVNYTILYNRCGFHTTKLSLKLFDNTIVPILTYASDIWSYCRQNWECTNKILYICPMYTVFVDVTDHP